MRRRSVFLTLAASALAATTLGGGLAGATTEPAAGGDELSFALLIGGPSNDGGFYQAMVDGLAAAADEDGAIDVTVRDNLASGGDASLENAVREAAASGEFDLIVAHGFDLVPAVAKFAPEYPDQLFATSLPVEGGPANVEVYLSAFEEIGYNAGFLAAQGTTANKVGFIGGPGLDFEKQAENGFRQAIAAYAPDAAITVVYTGTFEDPQLAQETATQMIADGVDSIWNQQAAGQSGVYTACAAAPDVNCFGNSSYSEAVNPDVVLASSVSDYTILVPLWAERIRTDAWAVGPDLLNIANGGTSVTDATAAGTERLPELQAAIDAYRERAAAGEIVVEPAPADG
jgi:basic membrane lipoprotein Med (substrate-binding protein (PBP1-ABC) superfamily)